MEESEVASQESVRRRKPVQPLLIIGKTGTLGTAFMKACERRSIPFVALSRQDINILDEKSIKAVFDHYKPWAVINATGYVKVDDAESNYDECYAVNAVAPALLAGICNSSGIRLMTFSSRSRWKT